jgi:hypothetical protein
MTMLRYRLRPIPWPLLGAIAACWLAVTDRFGPRFGASTDIDFMQVAAAVLGVQFAWLVSDDVDPPLTLLVTTPRTYRRAAAQRVLIWLVISTGALIVTAQYWPGGTPRPVLEAALAVLVLAAGVSFTTAAWLGSHLGGAVALGVLLTGGLLVAGIHTGHAVAAASPDPAAHAAWELSAGLVLICVSLVRLQRWSVPRRVGMTK